MTTKQVTIYTTIYCPYCSRAKNLLKRKGIAFKEVDVTEDQALRDKLEKKTGWMTVPMIFIGDDFIGGSDELHALEESGKLEERLKW